MGLVGARWAAALLLLGVVLAAVPGSSQPEPPGPEDVREALAPVLEGVVGAVLPPAENATGEDLHSEDISVFVVLDATNLEYQVLGLLFGGGKVQADVRADASLAFSAVSVERLDQALQAFTGDERATLNGTFGVPVDRLALTAEEIRLTGSGALLQAFQDFEAEAARGFLTDMVPGLRVLSLEVAWGNVQPASYVEEPDPDDPPEAEDAGLPPLRDPPLLLDVRLDLQYLDRTSVYDIVKGSLARDEPDEPDPSEKLRRAIEENQTLPLSQRTAFQVLSYGQLLDFSVPSGWRLSVEFHVPKGFTVESVTDELQEDGSQGAVFRLDGSGRSEDASLAGVVSASSRSLVTSVLFAVVLLVGVVLRVLVELASMGWYRFRHSRTKA